MQENGLSDISEEAAVSLSKFNGTYIALKPFKKLQPKVKKLLKKYL